MFKKHDRIKIKSSYPYKDKDGKTLADRRGVIALHGSGYGHIVKLDGETFNRSFDKEYLEHDLTL